MFRHRRHLHRWTCRLVVLWLFGIAAGVAHACLAADLARTDVQQLAAAVTLGTTAAPAGQVHPGAHQAAAAAGPAYGASDCTVNCQNFCVKSSLSIPTVKTAGDDAGGHGLPPPAVLAGLPMPDAPAAQRWTLGLEGGHAPPITIAFLRLAL